MFRNTVSLKILGCPQSIEDKKYKRNALLFNFGFVFDPNAETTVFQPVVKKLSGCFRTLEVLQLCALSYTLLSDVIIAISWSQVFCHEKRPDQDYQQFLLKC